MYLAVPGKILETADFGISRIATVEFGGVTRQVSLDFVPEAQLGDFVLVVHVGFAISRIESVMPQLLSVDLIENLRSGGKDLRLHS